MPDPKRVCGKCHQPAEKLDLGLCPPCKHDFDEWEKNGLPNAPTSTLKEGLKPWRRRPKNEPESSST